MTHRRNLTPSAGVHAMRRAGVRREAADRVLLKSLNGETHEGWALNVSRGGVRLILEEKVDLGQEFDVTVGLEENSLPVRRGRIVWVQEEPDGVVVGVEFVGPSDSLKAGEAGEEAGNDAAIRGDGDTSGEPGR